MTTNIKMRKLGLAAVVALVAMGASPRASDASDHIDGVKTTIDNAADLTDLFVFPSPQDPNKLVMIMNTHTLAFSGSRFSNAVDYKIRIRPIDDARTMRPSVDPAKERTVVCSFSGGLPLVDARQRATCTLKLEDGTETVAFETRSESYAAGGAGAGRGVRIFAGVRSDPWFLDLAKTLKVNAGLPMVGPGVNGLHGQNVLSIVVEIDKRRLPGSLLVVTAQTVRK